MEKFEALEKAMCHELEMLEQKVAGGEMSTTDLEKIDKLAHAMKSLATYTAMKEAEGYSDGMSGRRGRSPSTGRYVSRDGGYADGYSEGYSEGMRQSGHWPMGPDPRFRY